MTLIFSLSWRCSCGILGLSPRLDWGWAMSKCLAFGSDVHMSTQNGQYVRYSPSQGESGPNHTPMPLWKPRSAPARVLGIPHQDVRAPILPAGVLRGPHRQVGALTPPSGARLLPARHAADICWCVSQNGATCQPGPNPGSHPGLGS